MLRFDPAPTDARLAELAALGVDVSREPSVSGAFFARLRERGIDALERASDVTRATLDELFHAPHPEDETALAEARVVAAERAWRAKDGSTLDGSGVVIADVDSALFVFHPGLFRADGGYYGFVDVDGDGELTLDADGIDLDGDGAIGENERLSKLETTTYGEQGQPKTGAGFDPARDFLFVDANRNGARDYGGGFAEATPAYGEPIFVADDIDGNGSLTAKERVVRLGTSKVRAVRDALGDTWTRGGAGAGALVRYEVDPDPKELYAAARHGTMTAGVLVGGQAEGRTWRGAAPGAEIIHAHVERNLAEDLSWVIDQKPDVLLTEIAPYVGVSLDGSSEVDALLDAANGRDIVTVSPAGNLAQSGRHATLSLEAGGNPVLLDIQPSTGSKAWKVSLHQTSAARSVGVQVKVPNGSPVTVDEGDKGVSLGSGLSAYLERKVTPRGTTERHLTVLGPSPAGAWELDLVLDAGPGVTLEAYASDDLNPWRGAVAFRTPSNAKTLCAPSTADGTLRVGAYFFRDDLDGTKALHLYPGSSRGPRILGDADIDIAAPTKALSSMPPLGDHAHAYSFFGGTSGAGPHVAGALALLRQALPSASGRELRDLMLRSARRDPIVDAGGSAFGHGRLDVLAALALTEPTGDAPALSLTVEDDGTNRPTIVPRLEPASPSARVRWDVDYDGAPDGDWQPLGPRVIEGHAEGPALVVARAYDDRGFSVRALASVTVGTKPPPSAPPTSDVDGGCSCRETGRRPAGTTGALVSALAMAIAAWRSRARLRRTSERDVTSHAPQGPGRTSASAAWPRAIAERGRSTSDASTATPKRTESRAMGLWKTRS